ncbi:hypothetical protein, partial [Flagellimonas onchidii]|uniref:hypothetical protein n=1 Tax=Flagellimonas onchidii TaxID=2562684 RepID=UPI00197ACCA4
MIPHHASAVLMPKLQPSWPSHFGEEGPSVNPNRASVNWQAKTIDHYPTLVAVNRLNLTKMKKI